MKFLDWITLTASYVVIFQYRFCGWTPTIIQRSGRCSGSPLFPCSCNCPPPCRHCSLPLPLSATALRAYPYLLLHQSPQTELIARVQHCTADSAQQVFYKAQIGAIINSVVNRTPTPINDECSGCFLVRTHHIPSQDPAIAVSTEIWGR